MLFHYHHWTPHLEETENYYLEQGFQVHQRLGKYEGEFQAFNPPLSWNDFREKKILFRIIEMKKGNVNITFGYGKRLMFDHIGFFVWKEDHDAICERAKNLNWDAKIGERRTFLHTSYGFSVELQTHLDVIERENDPSTIVKMKIRTKMDGLEKDLSYVFHREIDGIETIYGDTVELDEVWITNLSGTDTITPNEFHVKRPSS